MRRTAQDIVEIGLKLIEVNDRLGHGRFRGCLTSSAAKQHTGTAASVHVGMGRTLLNANPR